MELKNKYVILEKLDGKYRPDMLIGNREVQGWCLEEPTVGFSLYLFYAPKNVKIGEVEIPAEDLPCAWTSTLKEIDYENMILTTKNSTYKIEIRDDKTN